MIDNFKRKILELHQAKRDINEDLAEESIDYFLSSFDSASWDGVYWPEGGKGYNELKETGQLRQDIANSIQHVDVDSVEIEVKNDYAAYLNNGTDNMPARKFIGQTYELTNRQKEIIINGINKIFK